MVAGWKWISIPPSFPFLGQERRKICFGYADHANLKWDSREKVRERSRRVDLNFPIKKKNIGIFNASGLMQVGAKRRDWR